MTTTKAQQKAVNKYIKNHYQRVNITLNKEDKNSNREYFQKMAEEYGMSMNQFAIESMKYCIDNKVFKSQAAAEKKNKK